MFGQFYRKMSGKMLDLVVKPTVWGEDPTQQLTQTNDTAQKVAVCYVLQTHSSSNATVADNETRRLKLPALLDPLKLEGQSEKVSVFYLHHEKQRRGEQNFPPRLERLIQFLQQHQDWDIHLVPISILWGRAPDKEDSLLKLLFTDTWATPNAMKQLMNIGLHGRDTYIEFHDKQSLRALITTAQEISPNISPVTYITNKLNHDMDKKREAILGPDLSDRRNVMNSLIKSPDVQDAIRKESIRDKISLQEAEQRAIGYVNEIASDYSFSTVRFAELALTRLWTQLYDGVEVHNFNKVRELAQDYEVIYVPCHRSHIDYLLLSYVIFNRGLRVPLIAAGDNLNMPFVGQLLREGGAFFIRRSFGGNALYTSVFKQYLYSVVARNTPLEYFIEGGRSRSGRLLNPKTGMLAMTTHAYLRAKTHAADNPNQITPKPIVFVPTYIGYERLMEGATYIGELQGKPKEAESLFGLLQSIRKIERIFGKVHVNFGEPVFLEKALAKTNAENVRIQHNDDSLPNEVSQAMNNIAYKILANINSAVVINPVNLLALALLSADKYTLDENLCIKLLDNYRQLLHLSHYDDNMQITALSGKEIIEYGLQLKLIKRSTHVLGNIISLESEQAILLTYFRNNVLHTYVIPALIATLVVRNGQMQRDNLMQIIKELYPFLKAEMFLKWSVTELDEQIEQNINALLELRLIESENGVTLTAPLPNTQRYQRIKLLSALVQQSLTRYYMSIMLMQQRNSGSISTKQVEELSHLLGQRLSALYESNSPEFFDKTLFQSFLKELSRLDYINTNSQGQIEYDERMVNMANYAQYVLDDTTLRMLQAVTNLSEDELQSALNQVAEQNAKRRAKRKAK
ncbi:glycerol-3-phosphate 1-O-acyltransferase PlsB [Moraxella sp. ZY210820]|uniref:glycerol-3-phosphate 1-O-acyltransferase PlsB n=1 Tax=unclassified Moraxella TaxID=2685852 RepID=UPI002731F668|nr:glycerol-3-phosphate 1-O-acyltransferase PlsB [Moraxella sp. ZY210820]WLF83980.1 glycerol-3-phosphate 1-O-acyltransferase PlsB [Moraxella sp. ZY210820]